MSVILVITYSIISLSTLILNEFSLKTDKVDLFVTKKNDISSFDNRSYDSLRANKKVAVRSKSSDRIAIHEISVGY